MDQQSVLTTVARVAPAPDTSAMDTRADFSMSGIDHPGTVPDISAALAGAGASIDELNTEFLVGSMSGETMFSATARIVLPASASVEDVRQCLETLAQDIMDDVDLHAEDG